MQEQDKHIQIMQDAPPLKAIFTMSITGLAFRNQIPHILGASELSFKFTQQYGTILMVGGIFIIENFALGQLIRAEGSTKLSMVGMMVGAE